MEIKLARLAPDENRLSKANTFCPPLFRFSFQHVHDMDKHTGCMDIFVFFRSQNASHFCVARIILNLLARFTQWINSFTHCHRHY